MGDLQDALLEKKVLEILRDARHDDFPHFFENWVSDLIKKNIYILKIRFYVVLNFVVSWTNTLARITFSKNSRDHDLVQYLIIIVSSCSLIFTLRYICIIQPQMLLDNPLY